MADQLVPAQRFGAPLGLDNNAPPRTPLVGGDPDEAGISITRYAHAIWRYKWLIIVLAVATAALGYVATRFMKPKYEVQATIWISRAAPTTEERSGPIRAEELLAPTSWVELFQSFTIIDSVVQKQSLYVVPARVADTTLFRNVAIASRLAPNDYLLEVGETGHDYRLVRARDKVVLERGALGDSVGRSIGLWWQPSATLFKPKQVVSFRLTTPRQASMALLDRLQANLRPNSTFMNVSLTGSDPTLAAATLNLWVKQFVATAAELKRRNLTEFTKILSDQLQYAGNQLRTAEVALETFRVNTITLPSESTPITPGLEETRGPVFTNFFTRKIEYDNARRDRNALEQVLTGVANGQNSIESIASVPGVLQAPGAEALNNSLKDLLAKQAELRVAERIYTSEHRTVKTLTQDIAILREQTLPKIATQLLEQLRQRESDLNVRLEAESKEMRGIPTRAIEEMRLRREVATAENLYKTLQNRYEEAKLAEASSVPDVSVLDLASPPDRPSTDSKPKVLALALAGGLGLGLVVALLLDRLDQRFRYPEQVTDELHLTVLGTVPSLSAGRRQPSLEDAAQVVEAFRAVRLRFQHMARAGQPIVCAITSTGTADGKSMVAANLSLSFAEAGYRTLLIDGDTRRGSLHEVFAADRRPGLTDVLASTAKAHEVLRPTSHQQLSLMPSGTRSRRSPELIAGAGLLQLLAELRDQFDAIIVDSPPLGAGIDAFALGAACGNALVVLRHGKTNVRATALKLQVLERLPIRIVGALLNEVRSTGDYQYYYADTTADETEDLGLGGAQIAQVTMKR